MPFWLHFDPLLAPFWPPKSIKFRPGTKNVTFAFWASRLDESSTLGVQGPQKPPKVLLTAIKKSIKFQLWFFSDFWCQNGPKITEKLWGGKVIFHHEAPPWNHQPSKRDPRTPQSSLLEPKWNPEGPLGPKKLAKMTPKGPSRPKNTQKNSKKLWKRIPQIHPNRICTTTWKTSPANQKTEQLKHSKQSRQTKH